LAIAVSTPKDSAQLIFSFESCQPLCLYYQKPAAQGTIQGDVIPPKMSYNPLQKFRLYTGMKIRPNRGFNGLAMRARTVNIIFCATLDCACT